MLTFANQEEKAVSEKVNTDFKIGGLDVAVIIFLRNSRMGYDALYYKASKTLTMILISTVLCNAKAV